MPLHHIVPKMMLRRFAHNDKRLRVVLREDPSKTFNQSVDKAAAEIGFYHVPLESIDPEVRDTYDPEGIEEAFSKLETVTSPIFSALTKGGMPRTDKERYHLALFVALQHTRGWRFRKSLVEIVNYSARHRFDPEDRDLQARFKEQLGSHGKPNDLEKVKDLIRECRDAPWKLSAPKQNLIKYSLSQADDMARSPMGRSLRIFRFEDTPLLTSDDAVGLWSPDSSEPRSAGWANARGVFMAFDRYAALGYMSTGKDRTGFSNQFWARHINLSIADRAERFIYHHPDDNPLADIILPSPAKLETVYDTATHLEDGRVNLSGRHVWR
jgi:hypothetical protein